MKKIYVASATLFLTLILSGCITQLISPQRGTPTKGGPVTASLNIDVNTVFNGSSVGAVVSIENEALEPIYNVKAEVYGANWTGDVNKEKFIDKIMPQSSWEHLFVINAPQVMAETTYNILADVKYHMNVSKTFSATVVSYDYLKRTGTKSSIKPSEIDAGGPLKIGFDIAAIPYVTGGEAGEFTSFPINVIITNVGSGKAYWQDPTKYPNNISVNVSGFNCSSLGGTSGFAELTRDGKTVYLLCQMSVGNDIINTAGIQTFTGVVTIEFDYIQTLKSQPIKVILSTKV